MKRFDVYIKNLRKLGRIYFTKSDALKEMNITSDSFYVGILKLKKKGDIISPARGLYVIVPPEDQVIGCIPAEQLVPILMSYWKADYYAGLLTASMYHGASHQKPQVFQVVTNKRLKSVKEGRVQINFIYKKELQGFPIQEITVRTGFLNISTAESTAHDLFVYPHHAGGLNNIATVISELIESINSENLIKLIKTLNEHAWIQRFGYILDSIDVMNDKKKDNLLHKLQIYLSKLNLGYTPLSSGLPTKGCPRNSRWMIIENMKIESDL